MSTITVRGLVVPGLQLGRKLGFPTLNIEYEGKLECGPGVFAARLWLAKRQFLGAAAIGSDFAQQNKLKQQGKLKLEIHVLDRAFAECYGQSVTVKLLARIGDLECCANLDDLRAKITRDITKIRAYFKRQRLF